MIATMSLGAAAMLLAVGAPPVSAQDMQAEKITNVRYKTVEMVKFKQGSSERAFKIIKDHFAPAARDAGIPMPVSLHPQSGEWDEIVIFSLSGGIEDLGYSVTGDEAKWMGAMAKREGGQDKAMALLNEYTSLIDRRDRIIVHEHME